MNVAMQTICISNIPEIEPVSIYLTESARSKLVSHEAKYLMVRNQYHALRESTNELSVGRLRKLTSNTFVATHPHEGRAPPVSHGGDKKAPLFLVELDPVVVPILVDERERGTEKLCGIDTTRRQKVGAMLTGPVQLTPWFLR